MTRIERVAVIGAGTMGHGIAYVACAAGYHVALTDSEPGAAERGVRKVEAAFDRAIERGKASPEQRARALAQLVTRDDPGDAARDADLVIEAIPERLELKRALFAELSSAARSSAILATNTSSLPIGEIATAVREPARVVGLHFFNPVPAMRLLEIVRGAMTSEATVETARTFASSLGKTPVVVGDSPGFATSRLGIVLGLEAIRMLEQGVANAQDIDRAMELGYNHPVGPLRLTDIVGLDVRLAIADHLHRSFGADTYRAPTLLRDMVRDGKLGKKTGEGFYRWEGEQ
ncbi:MAG: 3-hydroxyacyl-CoA dehydrogenase family protein [Gemmatimonadaceae bacterium]